MNSYKYILLTLILFAQAFSVRAQGKSMLIEQIAGKQIVRESFTRDGKLKSKQEFLVSKGIKTQDDFTVDVVVSIFDENLRLESRYSASYRCRAEESDVLLSIFTINPKRKKYSVSVKSGDFRKLYNLGFDMLNTLSLTMYIESGVLNVLGSKNKVDISNRSLSKKSDVWQINEIITIRPYLLGMRINTIVYDVTERLTRTGVLESQVFKEKGGDYFTITYNSRL